MLPSNVAGVAAAQQNRAGGEHAKCVPVSISRSRASFPGGHCLASVKTTQE